jgi:hypothetical protein
MKEQQVQALMLQAELTKLHAEYLQASSKLMVKYGQACAGCGYDKLSHDLLTAAEHTAQQATIKLEMCASYETIIALLRGEAV